MPIVKINDRPDLKNLISRFPMCAILPKIDGFKFNGDEIEISFEEIQERPEHITEKAFIEVVKNVYSCSMNGIPIGFVSKENVFVKRDKIVIMPAFNEKINVVNGRIENPISFFTTIRSFASAFKYESPSLMKIFKEGIPAIIGILNMLGLEIPPDNKNFLPSIGVWRHTPILEKLESSTGFTHIPVRDGGIFSKFMSGQVFSSIKEIENTIKVQGSKYMLKFDSFEDVDPSLFAFLLKLDKDVRYIFNCGDSVEMITFVKALIKFNPDAKITAIHDPIFDFDEGTVFEFPKISPNELDWFLVTFFNSECTLEGDLTALLKFSNGENFALSKAIRDGQWKFENGRWYVNPKISNVQSAAHHLLCAHKLMMTGEKPYLGLEFIDAAKKIAGKDVEAFESARAFFHKVLGEYELMVNDLEKADTFGKKSFRNAYFGIVLAMNDFDFTPSEGDADEIVKISREYSDIVRRKGSYKDFYDRILKSLEKLNGKDPRRIEVMARNYIGILHLEDDSNEEAIDEFETALSIAKEEEFKDLVPLIEMNIGYTLSKISPRIAKERLDNALKYALAEGLWKAAEWIDKTIAENSIKLGNFKLARIILESGNKLFGDFERSSSYLEVRMSVENLELDESKSLEDDDEVKMFEFMKSLYAGDEGKALSILPSIESNEGKYLYMLSKDPMKVVETISMPKNYLALHFASKIRSVRALKMMKKYGDHLYNDGFLLDAIFYEEKLAKLYELFGWMKSRDYHLNVGSDLSQSLDLYRRFKHLTGQIIDGKSLAKILEFARISFYSMNVESPNEIIESLCSTISNRLKTKVLCELKGAENVRIESTSEGIVYEADSGITEEPWVTYNEFFIYDFYVRGGSVYIKIDKSNLDLDDVIVTLDALVPLYKVKLEKAIASKISDIDQLTNIYTRRYTLDRLFEEFERSKRYGESLSMAMIDIDDFKRVNDTYGHDVGDEVLRKISDTLKDSVRKIDIVGRYGGEEFLIIFPHTNLDQSMKSCARILKNVREFYRWMRLTLSIGVVEASSCNNVDDFLKCSDLALYQAKFGGKNRIVKYSE